MQPLAKPIDRSAFSTSMELNETPKGISWRQVALKAAKLVGAILLFAAVSTSAGKLMGFVGAKIVSMAANHSAMGASFLRILGEGMQSCGQGAFEAGKFAFLSVSVPTKWCVDKGFPKALEATSVYVIKPVGRYILAGVDVMTKSVEFSAGLVYHYVLRPCGIAIDTGVGFLGKYLAAPCLERVIKVGSYVKNSLLGVIHSAYQNVIEPVVTSAGQVYSGLRDFVVIPLFEGVVNFYGIFKNSVLAAVNVVNTEVLKPLTKLVMQATYGMKEHVVSPIYRGGCHLAVGIKKVLLNVCEVVSVYVFRPLSEGGMKAHRWLNKTALIPLSEGLSVLGEIIKKHFVVAVQAIYDKMIQPFISAMKTSFEISRDYVLLPLYGEIARMGGVLKDGMVYTAKAIYCYVLRPIEKKVVYVLRTAAKVGHEMVNNFQIVLTAIRESYQWMAHKIALV